MGRIAPSGAAPCSPRRGARRVGPRRRPGAVLGAAGVGPGPSVSDARPSASLDGLAGELSSPDLVAFRALPDIQLATAIASLRG